ncbi:extracellular ribonuclease LE-like [Henckelia pumila]|uniref:extracellular ribonuclease LE-like n=1 Tax=Henckelia pumila TaxID=405737 RepID=UPI003C6E64BD
MSLNGSSILIKLLLLQTLCVLSLGQDFDFFYFVLQWPGSYCDTKQSCCYPTTGKPEADFIIRGLWPNYNDGTYLTNCDPNEPFDQSKISDLISKMQQNWPSLAYPCGNGTELWAYEWEKHGTCSESVLDQHDYFKSALELKSKLDLLQILQSEGINPDGGYYNLSSIKKAVQNAVGQIPWIECNADESKNSQLYQICFCVDSSGSNFIACPLWPRGNKCKSTVEFPSFQIDQESCATHDDLNTFLLSFMELVSLSCYPGKAEVSGLLFGTEQLVRTGRIFEEGGVGKVKS